MNSSLAEVINRQTTHKQKPSSYVLYSPVVEAKTKEKMMKEIQCKYVSNMVEYIMPCGNAHTTSLKRGVILLCLNGSSRDLLQPGSKFGV